VKQLYTEQVTNFPRGFQTPNYVEKGGYPFSLGVSVPSMEVAKTGYIDGEIDSATPTTLTLDAKKPTISVVATSP
jgi:hypothetical protein